MSKALYLGAGKDIFTYLNFPNIKTFISIESNPKNFNNQEDKIKWINHLIELFQKVDYELIKATKNYFKFYKENQTIEYFYNEDYEDIYKLNISKTLANA